MESSQKTGLGVSEHKPKKKSSIGMNFAKFIFAFCNQKVQCNQCRPDLPVSAAQKRQWRFWSLFRICICMYSQFLPFFSLFVCPQFESLKPVRMDTDCRSAPASVSWHGGVISCPEPDQLMQLYEYVRANVRSQHFNQRQTHRYL